MARFEIINSLLPAYTPTLPTRATTGSAGYDFYACADIEVPSAYKGMHYSEAIYSLEELSHDKTAKRATLVPTGIKCKLNSNQYLQLSMRSSTATKCLLVMPNAPGIIDSDYYNNPSNEGHIYIAVLNLGFDNVIIHAGDKIAQGIILNYNTVEEDKTTSTRQGGFGSTNG